ncbi:MAG: MmcQ/YjbR family DNA-binding protein [Spirosomaceae bacterium]|jgi:predicted DNA-binding protein (MmcQ/YjbR family)|nr:MmcQ/YjbR family DNA-binding protein [Spirosomataceae bacterium]
MIDLETVHEILCSMPDATEEPHFDKPAYKLKGKIFATFNIENKWVTIRLTPEQQAIFCENEAIYPVPNKWGTHGWTHVDLNRIKKSEFIEVLEVAYQNVKQSRKSAINKKGET